MKAIAIDGPSGAGKSSLAREAAKILGYIYVDTGALYRSIGLYVLRRGGDTKDSAVVTPLLKEIQLELRHIGGNQHVYLNGEDVSEEIRLAHVSLAAADVSGQKAVRDFLFSLQQDLAKENNVVMDGRDIGTVVLPDADVKIFLTASSEERARRRLEQQRAKGEHLVFEDVLRDVIARDEQDSNRAVAPLKPAEDGVILDTTGNTFEESLAEILDIIRGKIG